MKFLAFLIAFVLLAALAIADGGHMQGNMGMKGGSHKREATDPKMQGNMGMKSGSTMHKRATDPKMQGNMGMKSGSTMHKRATDPKMQGNMKNNHKRQLGVGAGTNTQASMG